MSTSNRFICKQLTRTDVAGLKQMLLMFGEAFEDAEAYHRAVPNDAYLEALLSKDHFIALAALVDGDVVGGLAAYVLDKFEQDRREIYIYDLAVLEQHRRKGIATGLMSALSALAAERDVYAIFVQADLVDAPAIAFYDTLGTRMTAHHFDIEVRAMNFKP
jgi:aminoglycoside 3-N-acetyltransferase I